MERNRGQGPQGAPPMILRRIATHLRAQNWTTVVIELAIVIGGVFIGIQAANWNQQRQERNHTRLLLSQVQVELTNTSPTSTVPMLTTQQRGNMRTVPMPGGMAIRQSATKSLSSPPTKQVRSSAFPTTRPCGHKSSERKTFGISRTSTFGETCRGSLALTTARSAGFRYEQVSGGGP